MTEAQRSRRVRRERLTVLTVLLIAVNQVALLVKDLLPHVDRNAVDLNQVAVYFVLTLVVGMGAAVGLILFISHRETVARDRRQDVEAGHTREVPG
jgi:hypothetical protein